MQDFFHNMKKEVTEQKLSNLDSLNEEILNIKNRISSDLQHMISCLQQISSKVQAKIWKILDSQEKILTKNYDYFLKKLDNAFELYEKTALSFENSKAAKYFSYLKNNLTRQCKEIPKYTSYNDEKHSFNQVISIMKKSFELFEEHFQDLVDFSGVKDLSDERIQTTLIFQAENDYTLDRTACLLDTNDFELSFEKEIDPQHDYNLNSIVMLNDDCVITSSIDRSIHVFSLENNTVISTINEMKFSPMVLCLIRSQFSQKDSNEKGVFSLNSKINQKISERKKLFQTNDNFLLASGGGDYDPNVYIWNLKSGKKLLTLPGHSRHITTIAQLPDPNILATGGYDSKIFIWDLNAGEPKLIINRHNFWIFKLKVSHSNNLMVSCSWDRTIILWKILYDEKFENEYKFVDLCSERTLKDDFEVCNINFSINFEDVMLSSNIGKTINVWDIKTGKIIKEMKLKQGFANELMILEEKESLYSNNKRRFLQGFYVLTSSIDDNRLRIFDVEKGEEIFSIENNIVNICAYNLNPKLQFFKYKDGDIGLVNVSHNDKNIKTGVWRFKKKKNIN